MGRWTCPRCGREFARARQSHVCVPGGTIDESFLGRPAGYRAIYDALIAHLRTLGPVHEDPVKVGVFLKNERKFAEVRPMARSLSLSLVLGRRLEHPRVSRIIRLPAQSRVHLVKLRSIGDVDDELKQWLTEAYDAAAGWPPS